MPHLHLKRLLLAAALACGAAKGIRGAAGISQQELEADFAQEPSKVHWARADARIAKTLSRAGHAPTPAPVPYGPPPTPGQD